MDRSTITLTCISILMLLAQDLRNASAGSVPATVTVRYHCNVPGQCNITGPAAATFPACNGPWYQFNAARNDPGTCSTSQMLPRNDPGTCSTLQFLPSSDSGTYLMSQIMPWNDPGTCSMSLIMPQKGPGSIRMTLTVDKSENR